MKLRVTTVKNTTRVISELFAIQMMDNKQHFQQKLYTHSSSEVGPKKHFRTTPSPLFLIQIKKRGVSLGQSDTQLTQRNIPITWQDIANIKLQKARKAELFQVRITQNAAGKSLNAARRVLYLSWSSPSPNAGDLLKRNLNTPSPGVRRGEIKLKPN